MDCLLMKTRRVLPYRVEIWGPPLFLGRRSNGEDPKLQEPGVFVAISRDNGEKIKSISRLHAKIYRDEETLAILVEDLGSANGTFVDHERVNPGVPRKLVAKSELQLGVGDAPVIFLMEIKGRHVGPWFQAEVPPFIRPIMPAMDDCILLSSQIHNPPGMVGVVENAKSTLLARPRRVIEYNPGEENAIGLPRRNSRPRRNTRNQIALIEGNEAVGGERAAAEQGGAVIAGLNNNPLQMDGGEGVEDENANNRERNTYLQIGDGGLSISAANASPQRPGMPKTKYSTNVMEIGEDGELHSDTPPLAASISVDEARHSGSHMDVPNRPDSVASLEVLDEAPRFITTPLPRTPISIPPPPKHLVSSLSNSASDSVLNRAQGRETSLSYSASLAPAGPLEQVQIRALQGEVNGAKLKENVDFVTGKASTPPNSSRPLNGILPSTSLPSLNNENLVSDAIHTFVSKGEDAAQLRRYASSVPASNAPSSSSTTTSHASYSVVPPPTSLKQISANNTPAVAAPIQVAFGPMEPPASSTSSSVYSTNAKLLGSIPTLPSFQIPPPPEFPSMATTLEDRLATFIDRAAQTLRCSLCGGLLRGASVLPCGHAFCRGCICTYADNLKKASHAFACPNCESTGVMSDDPVGIANGKSGAQEALRRCRALDDMASLVEGLARGNLAPRPPRRRLVPPSLDEEVAPSSGAPNLVNVGKSQSSNSTVAATSPHLESMASTAHVPWQASKTSSSLQPEVKRPRQI